jgi:hypothetical protein
MADSGSCFSGYGLRGEKSDCNRRATAVGDVLLSNGLYSGERYW